MGECMTGGDWRDTAAWWLGHCGGLELCVERCGVWSEERVTGAGQQVLLCVDDYGGGGTGHRGSGLLPGLGRPNHLGLCWLRLALQPMAQV